MALVSSVSISLTRKLHTVRQQRVLAGGFNVTTSTLSGEEFLKRSTDILVFE
jgi:hypothetical protein